MTVESSAPKPRLRDDLDALAALVQGAARHLEIDSAFVEKDFWVTELLRSVAVGDEITTQDGTAHPVRTVFKGGTSLSRIYGLIERFSEDVDILVVFPPDAGNNARDKALKRIADTARVHLGLGLDRCNLQESSTGIKRNVRYQYPRRFHNTATREYLLLEMGCRGGPDPHRRAMLRSMVADYAINNLGDASEAWEEFSPVSVEVLAPERTLLEKLALLHDLGARSVNETEPLEAIRHVGRHYYDIHCLLSNDGVRTALSALGTAGVISLANDINSRSQAAGWSHTPRPAGGFAASPAFDPSTSALAHAEHSYEAAMAMVYGSRPSFEGCLETVHHYRDLI